MMIKNIVCAIDRSPSSLQALGYAIALAKWQVARLSLLEVIEHVPDDTRTILERDLKRVLTARRASNVNAEIYLRQGNVVRQILAQAKASRADLIVMGSHGREGVQRQVLGSVAEQVLQSATCPVLTVRNGVRLARRSGSPFETILCPTGPSTAVTNAVAYARRLAQEAAATLTLMNAVEWSSGEEAGAAIAKVARTRSIDLIVMGVSGRGALDVTFPGSATQYVIRKGAWPVLTVRTL
jgi:nucleotide-binding universal stress UspA family protein